MKALIIIGLLFCMYGTIGLILFEFTKNNKNTNNILNIPKWFVVMMIGLVLLTCSPLYKYLYSGYKTEVTKNEVSNPSIFYLNNINDTISSRTINGELLKFNIQLSWKINEYNAVYVNRDVYSFAKIYVPTKLSQIVYCYISTIKSKSYKLHKQEYIKTMEKYIIDEFNKHNIIIKDIKIIQI
jgi:hypothetical protein